MANIAVNKPGTTVLLMGNEAVARGALEAGVGVAAAYPGSPTSEVIPALAEVAAEMNIYVEWSSNEKVATEVAAGASFAGIRSLSVMKQNGANVAADFIVNLNMTGIGSGGIVIFISDDPGGGTSNNEQDSRTIAKWIDNPLMEPSSAQEAKEMIKWAFEVSEAVNLLTFVRGVGRISYTRSNVVLGELPEKEKARPFFPEIWDMNNPTKSRFTSGPFPVFHKVLHEKLEKARQIFERSSFNRYIGPENPDLLIITCGACTSYCIEGVEELKAGDRVGVLKLGTTWPLPEKLVAKHLSTTRKVLFVEEMDPFVERSVMELAAAFLPETANLAFYGACSGHLTPYNELSTDIVIDALADILAQSPRPPAPALRLLHGGQSGQDGSDGQGGTGGPSTTSTKSTPSQPVTPDQQSPPNPAKRGTAGAGSAARDPRPKRSEAYEALAREGAKLVPNRPINMCPGCPHRATYWALKNAIQLDGRNGFLCGDIGCYSLGFAGPGFFQSRTMHAMGSGTGIACGLGKLGRFGFDQPVLAMCGDSTFYHAVMPALVNGVYNNSNFTLLIVDNSATAMTGFQPHPGTGQLATGEPAAIVDMEAVCRAFGASVEICDPFDLKKATDLLLRKMQEEGGPRVVIMRHLCQLVKAKRKIPPAFKMHVDGLKCLADNCGCNRLCTRLFACPGLMVDNETGKAAIDEALCVGCGLCSQICPAGAIAGSSYGLPAATEVR